MTPDNAPLDLKIHLVASAYMLDEGIPHLIVSYKKFNELAKQSGVNFKLSFYGIANTAEKVEEKIFESFGLGAESSPSRKLKEALERLKILENENIRLTERNKWAEERMASAEEALKKIIQHTNAEDEHGEFLDPHPSAIEEVARAHFEKFKKVDTDYMGSDC